jgi:hypothetical protein
MASYYVNDDAQVNGDHEVHVYGCTYFPSRNTYLGEFSSCTPAVTEAKKKWSQSNGCYYCCNPCHTS